MAIVDKGPPTLCAYETGLAQDAQMEGHIGLGQSGGMNNVGHWPTFCPQCTKDAQSVGFRQDLEDGAQKE